MRGIAWRAYADSVAEEPMIKFLAEAAKELRETADPKRKIIHVAVIADMDPTTIWRFEKGQWPRDADQVIAAYATELGLEPIDIWAKALELWISAEEPSSGEAAEAVRHVRDVAREQAKSQRQSPQKPPAKRKHAA
jgi:hypothetical protein